MSVLTRVRRSLMISASRSISWTISSMNSLYISAGTSLCVRSDSDNTFIEVIGVFSSCDTFETNSCLDSSSNCALLNILLISFVRAFISPNMPDVSICSRLPPFMPSIIPLVRLTSLTDSLAIKYAATMPSITTSANRYMELCLSPAL